MTAQHQARESHAVFLATRQHFHGLDDVIGREQHAAQHRAQRLIVVAGLTELADPVKHIVLGIELVRDVLSHIANISVLGPDHRAAVGSQITGQQTQQSRLTHTVRTHNRNFLARFNHGREILDNGTLVGLAQTLDRHGQAMQNFFLFKTNKRVLTRRRLHFDGLCLQATNLFQARGSLTGLGLVGGKTAHKVLQLANTLFGLGVGRQHTFARLHRRQHVIVVVAGVDTQLAVIQVSHVSADLIQEVTIVTDDDHRALVAVEHIFQPTNRVDIQVVGRLVQQQNIGVGEQGLCQQHTQFPARSNFAHRQLMLFDRNFQTHQQFTGTALGGITVVLGKTGLQFGGLHIVFFGGLWIVVDGITLLHGAPHFCVAHQHHVQHTFVFVGKLVLTQLAQAHARVQRYITPAWLQVAANDFHEGRLARPVGTNQAIAVASAQFDTDVFK